MTSQPPAIDLPTGRVSVTEIVERFHPVVPRMTSPAFAELAPTTPLDVAGKADGSSTCRVPRLMRMARPGRSITITGRG